MTPEEKLLDWMLVIARQADSEGIGSLARLKEVFPHALARHLAVAKALLTDPPAVLTQAWEKRKKPAKKRKEK